MDFPAYGSPPSPWLAALPAAGESPAKLNGRAPGSGYRADAGSTPAAGPEWVKLSARAPGS